MEFYDEQLLLKNLKKHGAKVSQLHVAKYNLNQLLLKSLRSFHENNSTDQTLFALMAEASLLKGKGLYLQSLKRLGVAKKMAYKFERNLQVLDILNKEVFLKLTLNIQFEDGDLKAIYSEIDQVEKAIKYETAYRKLWHQAFSWYRTRNKPRDEESLSQLQEFSNHPLLHVEPADLSFEAKLNFFSIHAIL